MDVITGWHVTHFIVSLTNKYMYLTKEIYQCFEVCGFRNFTCWTILYCEEALLILAIISDAYTYVSTNMHILR